MTAYPLRQERELIAPCGMNCSVCHAYLRPKNKCVGCRITGSKPGYCTRCIIVNCPELAAMGSGFCFKCKKYPCKRMKQLDKRYRLKYRTSFFENLDYVKMNGLDAFIDSENKKWRCPTCGGVVCIHSGYCLTCNQSDK